MHFRAATPERLVPRIAAYLAGTMASVVLIGWIFRLPELTSLFPGLAPMKANTAIGFLLLVGALNAIERRRWPAVQRGLALAAILMGLLTIFEYGTGIGLGFDEALFRDPGSPLNPGRMATATAANFVLLALSLCLPGFKWSDYAKESLALLVALSSLFAVVGHLYGVPLLYGVIGQSSIAMALHTAASFLVLAIGVLFVPRDDGFVRVFRGPSIASMVARYIVPAAILVPIVLGALLIRSRFSLGHPNLVMALSVVSDIVLLVILIWLLAVVIRRIEAARAEVQQQAETDRLTGIYNRRYFEASLEHEITRARRYDSPLSLIMFDVDHFKVLNDRHGHVAGDRALTRLARECELDLRAADVLCRYGGEEFAIIAPETRAVGAMALAQRIRQSIEAIQFEERPDPVTISVGVAVWEESFATMEDFIAAADSALYQAKDSGRNRECLYLRQEQFSDIERLNAAHGAEGRMPLL